MDPETVQVGESFGESGMCIPGALVFRCDVSDPIKRASDLEALKDRVISSLRQGDNAYVHYVAGIKRAPIVAAILSAMLMGIKLDEAKDIINQSRKL